MKPLSAFNVDQLLHIYCFRFTQLFPKWKQFLDKKKSSRIKYGYHHVMDLKSKCKLYGAKLLIAVL